MKCITISVERAEAVKRSLGGSQAVEARVKVQYLPPTKGERIAERWKFSKSNPERRYRVRRLYLARRLAAAERLLSRFASADRALLPEAFDALEALERDLRTFEAYDLLDMLRLAIDAYVDSLSAVKVAGVARIR